jgi:CDP-glucose 4,6-dehydratase
LDDGSAGVVHYPELKNTFMPMDAPLPFELALAGRRILVTGHTGFTGGWACLWLQSLGADIRGFALPPETTPSLFDELSLAMPSVFADICDYDRWLDAVANFQPELILHLAAQPLVRRSYREPLRTFAVNAMGTANVLEASRHIKSVRAVLCITTDKVYQNNEWPWPYRENDALGGKDPYSASKAAAEMVIQSYAASFPWRQGQGPVVAAARGGNIIGGGDWSEDRLIPDFVRAVNDGTALTLRYPEATRPWQHVLALVQGYLMIMAGLISEHPERFARSWNLGPQDSRQYSVREVLDLMAHHWQRPDLRYMDQPLPEAGALALDSTLARNQLGWLPAWDTERTVAETANWYRDFHTGSRSARALCEEQIRTWRAALQQ